MSPNGNQDRRPELGMLLRRYAQEADREAILNAYYKFASGDPETFPVQFAVLLEAHTKAMETAPELLKHRLGLMLKELREVMAAHQVDMRRCAEKVAQHEALIREELQRHRDATARQMAELRKEVGRIAEAAGEIQRHGDTLTYLTGKRIAWGLGLAAVSGAVVVVLLEMLCRFLFP
jgi:hypothetical protein